jgi:hypothetical protein
VERAGGYAEAEVTGGGVPLGETPHASTHPAGPPRRRRRAWA